MPDVLPLSGGKTRLEKRPKAERTSGTPAEHTAFATHPFFRAEFIGLLCAALEDCFSLLQFDMSGSCRAATPVPKHTTTQEGATWAAMDSAA
jgi:hypothetical protein